MLLADSTLFWPQSIKGHTSDYYDPFLLYAEFRFFFAKTLKT